jgi:hypothetical protein
MPSSTLPTSRRPPSTRRGWPAPTAIARTCSRRISPLTGADLHSARLVNATVDEARFTACSVYGTAVWDLTGTPASQTDLIITDRGVPAITVDDLEVAQFVYLLLHNEKIRNVIDTITSKVVLILGRFTPERKAVLAALRDELRRQNYLPILFDFEPTRNRDLSETVSLLARMARFVIADLTDAKRLPQELGLIVPNLPSVPVQPLLLAGTTEYAMFEHWQRFPWVLPVYKYKRTGKLLANLAKRVSAPAERKAKALQPPAARQPRRPTDARPRPRKVAGEA